MIYLVVNIVVVSRQCVVVYSYYSRTYLGTYCFRNDRQCWKLTCSIHATYDTYTVRQPKTTIKTTTLILKKGHNYDDATNTLDTVESNLTSPDQPPRLDLLAVLHLLRLGSSKNQRPGTGFDNFLMTGRSSSGSDHSLCNGGGRNDVRGLLLLFCSGVAMCNC